MIFVGYAGQFGWRYGIASTWVGVGNALIGSLLAWVILGRAHAHHDAPAQQRHDAGVL